MGASERDALPAEIEPAFCAWREMYGFDLCDPHVQDARRLLTRALALGREQGRQAWQPIETVPKNGTLILLWMGGTWQHATIGRWSEEDQFPTDYPVLWRCYDGRYIPNVPTHWMSLPDPPAGREGAGR